MPPELVIEAHGSFATAHCLRCNRHASIEHVVRSGVREGRVVRCMHDQCEGLVKPDIVFFGEGLPNEFFSTKRVSEGGEEMDEEMGANIIPAIVLAIIASRSWDHAKARESGFGPFGKAHSRI